MATRQEQKEQRRQQILMAALALFVKKGYQDTKISDIAAAADMSTGLLFHYFPSKEALYETLVRMGLEGTKAPQKLEPSDPLAYFGDFLDMLFRYAAEQPWIFQMFVLMAQARRSDATPPRIRAIAMEVDQMAQSAEIIRMGQQSGVFRQGDPLALSAAFWCSVQGIMEQLAADPAMPLPRTEWLLDMIRNKEAGNK